MSGTFGDSEKVTVTTGRFVASGGVTTEAVTLSAGWTQKNQMASWFAGKETLDSKGQKVVEFYFNRAGKLKCRKERGVITPPSLLPRYGMVSEQTAALDALMSGHYFDTPKPVELIKDLARWFTSGSDIVLDFFVGSGTAAQSVLELNAEDGGTRRFMVVQLPEPLPADSPGRDAGWSNIAQITRRRIELAGERLGGELTGDGVDQGFRAYVLSDTHFSKWRVSSDVDPSKLEQHLLTLRDSAEDDATADSLLSELLLKQGYSLTEAATEENFAGLTLQSVEGGLLLAYLDEHTKPTLHQLREIVDQEPARLVILEDAFQGDDELKTNLAQLCKSKGVELWTV